MTKILALAVVLAISATVVEAADPMNAVAEKYAHLVLALGQHDPDYVDAFYGPAEWKTQAEKEKKSLNEIEQELHVLFFHTLPEIPKVEANTPDGELLKLRRDYLWKQMRALGARVQMLNGDEDLGEQNEQLESAKKSKFDRESRALYDAVAPTYPDSHFDEIIKKLEAKIPGKGELWKRYEEWRKPFVIPKDPSQAAVGCSRLHE